jgi:hypothetical protein
MSAKRRLPDLDPMLAQGQFVTRSGRRIICLQNTFSTKLSAAVAAGPEQESKPGFEAESVWKKKTADNCETAREPST